MKEFVFWSMIAANLESAVCEFIPGERSRHVGNKILILACLIGISYLVMNQ